MNPCSLPLQSLRLHVLGQEAVEQEEEDPVAAGHPGGGSRGDHPHRRHRRPRHDHRHSRLGRQKGKETDNSHDFSTGCKKNMIQFLMYGQSVILLCPN